MQYTESQLREYLVDFLADSSLMYCFEAKFSIDFLREFVGHIDMDANWIDVTEPKLKEFLSKDRKRLWD